MEIKVPDLGVESAEVSEIMVSVGDSIAKDDNIVLLESDKASVEVPSSAAGKVTNITVSVGDQVTEGSVLIEIEAEDDKSASEQPDAESDVSADEQAASSSQDGKASNTGSSGSESSSPDESQAESSDDAGASESATYALPDLGVEEAQVAEVMVAVGDKVEAEESILLIESDKASVEVPAPVSGTIEKILVNAGDTVTNGQDFIVIAGGQSSASKATAAPSSESYGKTIDSNDSDSKKATKSENKPAATKSTNTGKPQPGDKKLSESEVNDKLTDVYAGPAVRKLARQLGIDITKVSGSAVNERIIKEDLFAYVKEHMTSNGQGATAASTLSSQGLPSLPDMSKSEIWGETETIDLSRLQKVSIPQLNYNTYLPQVTQFDLADITDTEALRGELKGDFKKQGIGLTILAFIVKATAYALTQHPKFNSHLSDDNTQIIIRKSVNMGIAVATDDGLIVPVIKDAQAKGIKQLAIEIGELAAKARDKKLGTKDLQGASFTISSQGNLGGTYFTPLVNWPQVGILGISEATKQPRWNEDKQTFEPRLMLPLSLSYDHRVINGADAAVFTRYVAKLLADPRRILL